MLPSLTLRWFRGRFLLLLLAMGIWGVWIGLDQGQGDENTTPRSSSELAGMGIENDAASSPTDDVWQVTFDDLKLDLKKGQAYDASLLTDRIKQLDGKTVRIRGFIFPTFKSRGITQFVLSGGHDVNAPDSCVVVDLTPPTTVNFVVHAIDVEGVFSLREIKTEEGSVIAVYHLEGKKVVLVPGVQAPPPWDRC